MNYIGSKLKLSSWIKEEILKVTMKEQNVTNYEYNMLHKVA